MADPTFTAACVLFLALIAAHRYVVRSLERRIEHQAGRLEELRTALDRANARSRRLDRLAGKAVAAWRLRHTSADQ